MQENRNQEGNEGGSILLQEYESDQLKETLHLHRSYELAFVLQGSGEFVIGGQTGVFSGGSLILCPPGVAHALKSSPDAGYTGLALRFAPRHLPKAVLELEEMTAVRQLFERASRGLLFKVVDRERLKQRLRSVHRAHGALRLARLYVALELAAGLESSQVIGEEKEAGIRAANLAARLATARHYLAARLQEDVRRGDVARHLGMEETAFSRFFHEATGSTFVDYLANLRVRQAATLLSSRRGMPLAEVAQRSGFRSLASFHRQFRRRLGMTPAGYRQAANAEAMEP